VTVRTTIPRALHQAERWLGAAYDTTAGKALPRNTIRMPISYVMTITLLVWRLMRTRSAL